MDVRGVLTRGPTGQEVLGKVEDGRVSRSLDWGRIGEIIRW